MGGAEREAVLAQLGVSRETAARLDNFLALLDRWQKAKNLVAASTLAQAWHRHILDSGQLLPLLGAARNVADLGSGAGFPGLVLALLAPVDSGISVHLIESNQRKAAFLMEAVRVTGAPARVHLGRIETVLSEIAGQVDIVTARALAPLPELLEMAEPLLKTGARGLFPKGREAERELTDASKSWRIRAELIPSLTDPASRIIHVLEAERTIPGRMGDRDD